MRVVGLNTYFHYLCVLCCNICPVVNKNFFSQNAHACRDASIKYLKKSARIIDRRGRLPETMSDNLRYLPQDCYVGNPRQTP